MRSNGDPTPPKIKINKINKCIKKKESYFFKKKERITRHIKRQKKPHFEETEQASEPDMVGMLELSDRKFKTSMINMLRALMGKADSM